VALGLHSAGAHVTVHARNAETAAAVAALAQGEAGVLPPPAGSWDLLVNCTPVGMHPATGDSPIPAAALAGSPGRLVYDLVYNPQTTRLLAEAAAAGCRTIGGLEMLVAQAEEQFRWWTGISPRPGVMEQAALARLAEFATQ
jgi:shikimate 5-dehydrogenase